MFTFSNRIVSNHLYIRYVRITDTMVRATQGATSLGMNILGMVVGILGVILAIMIFGGFAEPLLQAIYNLTNVNVELANGTEVQVESVLTQMVDPTGTMGGIIWGAVVILFVIIGLFSVVKFATPGARR